MAEAQIELFKTETKTETTKKEGQTLVFILLVVEAHKIGYWNHRKAKPAPLF